MKKHNNKSTFFFIHSLVTAAAVKDSISGFTFQKMQLDDDFDCDACGCSASGGSMGFSLDAEQ
jgi:hypothetical protein